MKFLLCGEFVLGSKQDKLGYKINVLSKTFPEGLNFFYKNQQILSWIWLVLNFHVFSASFVLNS